MWFDERGAARRPSRRCVTLYRVFTKLDRKVADAGHLYDNNCREVHISGTIAPQTLAVTVDKANEKALIPAGTQLSLAVGATGQTVRVKAEACATGTGSSLVLTIKQVELRPANVTTTRTGTTRTGTARTGTTQKKHEDEQGDHHGHKGGTTTAATTTTTP